MSAATKKGTPRNITALRAIKTLGLGVGPRQFRCVASDGTPDRMGDILEPQGVQLLNFRRNPVVLAQHDSASPIARCLFIGIESSQVIALVEFPPEGVSDKADEYCRLIKSGIVSAVSVGFIPLDWEPISGAGYRYTSWELIELSVVSVPANQSALITERSASFGTPDHGLLQRARARRRRLAEPGGYDGRGAILSCEPEVRTKEEMHRRVQELRVKFGLPSGNAQAALMEAEIFIRAMYW